MQPPLQALESAAHSQLCDVVLQVIPNSQSVAEQHASLRMH
jgi:hypothetical protein